MTIFMCDTAILASLPSAKPTHFFLVAQSNVKDLNEIPLVTVCQSNNSLPLGDTPHNKS